MKPGFFVFRCNECERFFGSLTSTGNIVCSSCGNSEKTVLVESVDSADELVLKVQKWNVPAEIRSELETATIHQVSASWDEEEIDGRSIMSLIKRASDEEGILTLQSFTQELEKSGKSVAMVTEMLESAEYEGILLRLTRSSWRLLQ